MYSRFNIHIKGLKLFGYHGLRKAEKEEGQYFIFDIDVAIKSSTFKDEDLSTSINYSDIIRLVKSLNKEKRFDLLETFSSEISKRISESYPLARKIDVRISKPDPPIKEELENVGVTLMVRKEQVEVSLPRKKIKTYLSLGSNMGNREDNLRKAIDYINNLGCITIEQVSSIYETEPMYVKDQKSFYNIVASAVLMENTDPFVLLGNIKSIEYKLGRSKDTVRFGPRPIDIDILYIQGIDITSDFLTIPHERFAERPFVLIPLNEVSPHFKIDGKNIRTLIGETKWEEKVVLLKDW